MNIWAALGLTVFVWWFATGAILLLDGLPRRTFRWTIGIATALTGVAFAALVTSAYDTSTSAAYIGFICAIAIWGWNEIAFLMGGVTGPRRSPCPADVQGWPSVQAGVPDIALSRGIDRGLRRPDRRSHLECTEQGRAVDLPHPVGDAREREAQHLPRRAEHHA